MSDREPPIAGSSLQSSSKPKLHTNGSGNPAPSGGSGSSSPYKRVEAQQGHRLDNIPDREPSSSNSSNRSPSKPRMYTNGGGGNSAPSGRSASSSPLKNTESQPQMQGFNQDFLMSIMSTAGMAYGGFPPGFMPPADGCVLSSVE